MIPNPRRSEWPEAVRGALLGLDAHFVGVWDVADAQEAFGEIVMERIRRKYLPDYQVPTGGHRGYHRTTVIQNGLAYEFFTLTRRVKEPEGNVPGEGFIQGTIRFTPDGPRHSWDRDDADLELWLGEVRERRNTEQQLLERVQRETGISREVNTRTRGDWRAGPSRP